jgi:hypothetical protein
MARRTIVLKPTDALVPYDEARVKAGVTITPGMLIELDANGEALPHGTAGAVGEGLVAIEDGYIGKTIDDAYAAGELVRYVIARGGVEFNLILVGGANATTASFLTSNGDGKVKVAAGADARAFKSRDTLNLTALPDGRINGRAL